MPNDSQYIRAALRLAKRAYGLTSPNPMVGALLVKRGQIIGRGWHHRAGEPHAEIEALNDAARRGHRPEGATLYVTLEPCCTHGRTPPCTGAIVAAGIKRVVVGTTDPNPRHRGRGLTILRRAGVAVTENVLSDACSTLNEAFNYWIVRRQPLVTVKAAMTLDGKIAAASGESKWITGARAREFGMQLRRGSDAILVGINTILADNPHLTVRRGKGEGAALAGKKLRRIVLDAEGRTPLDAAVVADAQAPLTTIVVSRDAPRRRVEALARRVNVLAAPLLAHRLPDARPTLDLRWLLNRLGAAEVTSVLVEGGGEVNASFLLSGLAQRVAFFYAPLVLGGREAHRAVAGDGARTLSEMIDLTNILWRRLGPDWLLTASCVPKPRHQPMN